MVKKSLTIFFIFACFVFGVADNAFAQSSLPFLKPGTTYLWPTDASHFMSSSFAETRDGHFHAALDIKTWGVRGYKVYATRAGILYRVATGPTGYGNVIYLKHDDGSFSVYAHLEDFIPKIRHLVDSLRFRTYSFEFDSVLESRHIHFKKGDVIGYTGASGIGPPHLHFELRTPLEHPFNPLLTNLRVADHIPPIYSGLSVEPITPNASVQGKKEIYIRRPVIRKGIYEFGTIHVTGTVGLGVRVFDHSDKVHNVYAVYDLKLMRGNDLIFHSRVDSFSYAHTHELYLDRVYPILKKTGKGFQRMFVEDGNQLPFYLDTKNRGLINLPPGSYDFRIIAADFWGNKSTADVKLVVDPPLPGDSLTEKQSDSLSIPEKIASYPNTSHWFWTNNWFSPGPGSGNRFTLISPDKNGDNVSVYSLGSPWDGIPFSRNSPVTVIEEGNKELILHRIFPGKESNIFTPDRRFEVDFSAQSVFDTLSVWIRHGHKDGHPVVIIGPDTDPLNKSITLRYKLSDSLSHKDRWGFYGYDPHSRSFKYYESNREAKALVTHVDQTGIFYLLRDTTAPAVNHPRVYKRNDGRWLASVDVNDNLSGIDFQHSLFFVNSVRGIAEYNPESNKLIYYLPSFVPKKVNKLSVVVYDQRGNSTSRKFTVSR